MHCCCCCYSNKCFDMQMFIVALWQMFTHNNGLLTDNHWPFLVFFNLFFCLIIVSSFSVSAPDYISTFCFSSGQREIASQNFCGFHSLPLRQSSSSQVSQLPSTSLPVTSWLGNLTTVLLAVEVIAFAFVFASVCISVLYLF